jgi:hypothetical protein
VRVVVVVVSVVPQLDRKTATKARRVREISLFFIHQGNAWGHSTGRVYFPRCVDFLEYPTEDIGEHESKLMKIYHSALGLVAVSGLFFSGCANNKTETTQTQTDPSKRVYTQKDLRKTGETNPAAALEKTDPSVRMSGQR